MNKNLLIKVISGQASKEEEKIVLQWLSKNKEREKYFIGLKNLWISQHLSKEEATAEDLQEIRALIGNSSHKRNRTQIYKYISAAACLLLAVSVFFNFYKPASTKSLYNNQIQQPQVETLLSQDLSNLPDSCKNYIYTVRGTKARLVLPDSSVVWLNSDSKITYPTRFTGSTREVALSGEALFEVVKNADMPMIVTTQKGFQIKVRGTKFNIRSYPDDSKSVATLYNGNIELITKDKKGSEIITKIEPNQAYEISDDAAQIPKEANVIDISDESAWQEGKLIFDNTPLAEVIKSLERWHGTTFTIKDQAILNYNITATFRSESIVQIMEMIRFCALIDYTVKDNTVELRKRN